MFTREVPTRDRLQKNRIWCHAVCLLGRPSRGNAASIARNARPASIDVIKLELIKRGHEFIARQRVSQLKQTVVPVSDL